MDALNSFTEQLESIPGYSMAMDWFNEKAEEKYQTKDPFYAEIHGKKKRRKAPETCTPQEQKAWKRVKKRAWLDDRNFFGCYPVDFGIGLAPLAALIPVVGPLLMFAVHGRLVAIADREFHLPAKVVAQMHANILFDLIISLVPLIGSIFAWINACSTRNAALVHTQLVKREMKQARENHEADQLRQYRVQMRQQSATPQKTDRYTPSQPQNGSPEIQKPQSTYDPTLRGRQM